MARNFFSKSIVMIILILMMIGMIVFYIDPWQQFRYDEKYYNGDQRILNIGLAKNYKYKVAIIGTSTSENILKKDIDKKFKTSSVNLSIAGSTASEQINLLDIILNNKNVNIVIYGLDFFSYNRTEKRKEYIDYTKTKNFYKYLFNINVLRDTAKIIIQKIIKKDNKNWIYTKHFWGNKFKYSEDQTLCFELDNQSGRQNLGILKEIKSGYKFETMKENFDYFLKKTQENEKIEYIVYLPPYSILYWYWLEKYNSLDDVLKFKKYIYDKTKNKKNILIFDFQDKKDIISDLNNYKDAVHYSPFINERIVKDMENMKVKNYNLDFDKNIKILINENKKKFINIKLYNY